ncbi:universal stress protein [soil metagenome]
MPVIQDQVGLSIDRVVLATDFSPVSEAATPYAKGLARRFSSGLTLAHVVDLSVATRSEDALVGFELEHLRSSSAENLERLLQRMGDEGVRATAQTVEAHHPAAAIVRLAEELKADLIVMGTQARQGLAKMILGSCAEGVIRHAHCPVLTVGPKAKAPAAGGLCFNSILFATDLDGNAAHHASVALKFAQDSMAKIYFCHVRRPGDEDAFKARALREEFERSLLKLIPNSSYEWCDPQVVVEDGPAAVKLLEVAGAKKVDLIVLGAKRSFSWFTNLKSGVVGQVIAGAECPVMTLCGD